MENISGDTLPIPPALHAEIAAAHDRPITDEHRQAIRERLRAA